MGITGKKYYINLEKIRKIRNHYAHNLDSFEFEKTDTGKMKVSEIINEMHDDLGFDGDGNSVGWKFRKIMIHIGQYLSWKVGVIDRLKTG